LPDTRPVRAPARTARRSGVRAVTPMARRLLRLLMTNPMLAARLGEQQLELLTQHPLVRQLKF